MHLKVKGGCMQGGACLKTGRMRGGGRRLAREAHASLQASLSARETDKRGRVQGGTCEKRRHMRGRARAFQGGHLRVHKQAEVHL